MTNIKQQFWDEVLQPRLRKWGVDIRRYPPKLPEPEPHWTDKAFSRLLATREDATLVADGSADDFIFFCIQHAEESHAQLYQDLFVRWQLGEKRSGYFVEFGATDGISLSNTKCLEERLDWTGILAEPARCWHDRLKQNRTSVVDTRCVWSATGQSVLFNEVSIAEFSTVQSLSDKDHHAAYRQDGSAYAVETVSLNDLLLRHGAPAFIDYLSIDTEGSELDILSAFDFNKYTVGVITVEHNLTPDRQKIFELLTRNGYTRKFEGFSRFDDWYVNNALLTSESMASRTKPGAESQGRIPS